MNKRIDVTWFVDFLKTNKYACYRKLLKKLQRKDAIEIGLKFNLKDRSVDVFFKSCLGKYLAQPKAGWDEKR